MMKKSGELLQNTLIPFLKGTFDNYQEEHQNSEYESFSFSINQYSFRNGVPSAYEEFVSIRNRFKNFAVILYI